MEHPTTLIGAVVTVDEKLICSKALGTYILFQKIFLFFLKIENKNGPQKIKTI